MAGIQERIEKLKEIMGSQAYEKTMELSWAVMDFIFGFSDEATRLALMEFLIENQGTGDIPETMQFSDVPGTLSIERFTELDKTFGNEDKGFLDGIVSERVSVKEAAKRILQRLKGIEDDEHRVYFLGMVMFSGFCPYKLYTGKVKLTQKEIDEIEAQNQELTDKIRSAALDKIRFFTKSAQGEYMLSILNEAPDDKTRMVLISDLIEAARHNPCECITEKIRMQGTLSSILGGGIGGIGIEIG